jgi:hypothetical protein
MGVVPPTNTPDFEQESSAGVFLLPTSLDENKKPAIAKQLRDLGVKWVRLNYFWRNDNRYDVPDLGSPN